MAPNSSLILLYLALISTALPIITSIGVNWGTEASHPLPATKVVELLKSNNITKVKLLDADPHVLEALSGSNIRVTLGIPNSMLKTLNSSSQAAVSWVHDNVTRYSSSSSSSSSNVLFEYVAVGDDPFQQIYVGQFQPLVIGAAINIQRALHKANVADQIKVVVPCSYDTVKSESDMPSKGHFRSDLNQTMFELLTFLNKYHSPLFVTISPFIASLQNKNISLDFAVFREMARVHHDRHRTYKNYFDLSYDMVVTALTSVGFPEMDIVVSKIGWPTDGAQNAMPSVAESFITGLMSHHNSKLGTPLRPRKPPTETYIYSLFDEDKRSIATGNFERHWGMFTFDGQSKYRVDFGHGSKSLVNAQNVEYLPSKWCVVNNNKDLSNATSTALDTCSATDCSALSPGGSCFNISWPGNISYAFNSYFQQHNQRVDSCDFGGLGLITTVDPSMGKCIFPVELRTSSSHSLSGDGTWLWVICFTANMLFLSVLLV